MNKLLQEISVIPGVAGSCIFDRIEGPLCKDLHPSLPEELLKTIGVHLVRLIKMGTMSGLDIASSHFRFDKYSVVGMPLDDGAVLLTICDAQANCSLVATTAAMLAADMRDELARGVSTPPTVEEKLEVVAATSATADLPDDPEMENIYVEMETALASAIGPVAGLLIGDYIGKWKLSGPAVRERLPELAEMLREEIGDKGLATDFFRQVKEIF